MVSLLRRIGDRFGKLFEIERGKCGMKWRSRFWRFGDRYWDMVRIERRELVEWWRESDLHIRGPIRIPTLARKAFLSNFGNRFRFLWVALEANRGPIWKVVQNWTVRDRILDIRGPFLCISRKFCPHFSRLLQFWFLSSGEVIFQNSQETSQSLINHKNSWTIYNLDQTPIHNNAI